MLPKIRLRLLNLGRTGRLIYAAAPHLAVAWSLLLLLQGLLPVGIVRLTRTLVDSLVQLLQAPNDPQALQTTLLWAALMGVLLLLTEVLQGAADYVRTAQSEQIQDHVYDLVHAQAVTMDFAAFESPDFYDRQFRATSDAGQRTLSLLESSGALLQNSLTLLGMAAVLLPYGAWLPLVLLLSTLPALAVVIRFKRRHHRWWEQTTVDRRWVQYFNMVLTDAMTAAELRIFALAKPFRTAYQHLRRRLRMQRLRLTRNQSLARVGASTIGLLAAGLVAGWMVLGAMRGTFTLGDLALIYQAFSRGQGLMRTLLNSAGQIYGDSLYLGNLFEYLDMQPELTDPPRPHAAPVPLRHGISFRDVTFAYPGSARPALRHFNLHVPAGQVAAVVGHNGAGKSTLLKLLCRLYDPQSGSIELDGIDLRDLRQAELRRLITVLFQSPVPYHATAAENIAYGDVEAALDEEAIEAAARAAGAHELIAGLPQGYATMLGKFLVKGADLSAGEWQRVALARAYARQAQILVLDEPTSAMDSWSEADWFARLRTLVDGRTGIVITHRFTIAMRADVIHVMRAGRIVESGTHAELVAQGGLYAESWQTQMAAAAQPAF